MDRETAKIEFEKLRERIKPKCNLPMNKQKQEKKHYAYLTGIINMLTEETLGGCHFIDNPKGLIIVTSNKRPIRTFSRYGLLVFRSLHQKMNHKIRLEFFLHFVLSTLELARG